MEQRLNLFELDPEGYKRVAALQQHVASKVDATLLELVKLRASIVNGCSFCVDMHATDALEKGEEPRRLFAVAAWRESPFFSEAERSALAMTDALTRLGDDGLPDDVYEDVLGIFGEKGVADLALAIATINVWNRLSLTGRKQPPPL
jgi:AhpD family alkylhydroperoxidase